LVKVSDWVTVDVMVPMEVVVVVISRVLVSVSVDVERLV
jgi:hypothetical protein